MSEKKQMPKYDHKWTVTCEVLCAGDNHHESTYHGWAWDRTDAIRRGMIEAVALYAGDGYELVSVKVTDVRRDDDE